MQAPADAHTGAQIRTHWGSDSVPRERSRELALLAGLSQGPGWRCQPGALPPRWVFLKPTFCGISLRNVNTLLSREARDQCLKG